MIQLKEVAWDSYVGHWIGGGTRAQIHVVQGNSARVIRIVDRSADDGTLIQEQLSFAIECIPKVFERVILNRDGAKYKGVVMERAGGDLEDWYLLSRPPSVEKICKVFERILRGLAGVHERGYAHFDIKPANLTETGMILDWETCCKLEPGMRVSRGSPQYIPPEICLGRPCGEKSDMWCLGSSLYYLLTWELPWNDFDLMFSSFQIRKNKEKVEERLGKIKETVECRDSWSGGKRKKFFDSVILGMLKFEMEERCSSKEAYKALCKFMEEENISVEKQEVRSA